MKEFLAVVFSAVGIALLAAAAVSADSLEPFYLVGGHTSEVCSLAFSPDGRLLASVANDRLIRIRLWQLPERRILRTIDIPLVPWAGIAWPAAVAFSPDGRLLAVAALNGLRLYDVDTGASVASRAGEYSSVAFSPDGTLLAVGSRASSVLLWRVSDRGAGAAWRLSEESEEALQGNVVFLAVDAPTSATYVSFGSDAKTLAVACNLGTWIYDLEARVPVLSLTGPTEYAAAVTLTRDGKYVATAARDGFIYAWDARNGALVVRLGRPPSGAGFSAAFSPDAKTLAFGTDARWLFLWDVEAGAEVSRLSGQPASGIYSVAFSPNGKSLAVGYSRKIGVFDVSHLLGG